MRGLRRRKYAFMGGDLKKNKMLGIEVGQKWPGQVVALNVYDLLLPKPFIRRYSQYLIAIARYAGYLFWAYARRPM